MKHIKTYNESQVYSEDFQELLDIIKNDLLDDMGIYKYEQVGREIYNECPWYLIHEHDILIHNLTSVDLNKIKKGIELIDEKVFGIMGRRIGWVTFNYLLDFSWIKIFFEDESQYVDAPKKTEWNKINVEWKSKNINESKEEEISHIKEIVKDFADDYDLMEETTVFLSRLNHDNTGIFYFIYDYNNRIEYPNTILFSVVYSSKLERVHRVQELNDGINILIERIKLMGFECSYSKIVNNSTRSLNQKNVYIKYE